MPVSLPKFSSLRGYAIAVAATLLTQKFVLAQEVALDTFYQQGVSAYAEGEYERAANIWLIEAYEGSSDAQFNLGVLYLEGKGVGQSREEAVFWFLKAAEDGHMEAQYNLGHLLLEERGDPEKVSQGIGWWKQSADGGFPVAQYNYGRALFYGIGIDEDRGLARKYLEMGAAADDERSRQFIIEKFGMVASESRSVTSQDSQPLESAGKRPAAGTELENNPPVEISDKRATGSISSTLYVIVSDQPVLAYTRFNNHAPIIGQISVGTLLRVVSIDSDWLQVQSPGGVPGWIRDTEVEITDSVVRVTSDSAVVYADPTESHSDNDIGILDRGEQTLLIGRMEGWVRVLTPDQLPIWIETRHISQVEGNQQDIEAEWQVQSVRQKREALSATVSGDPQEVDASPAIEIAPESFNDQIVASAATPASSMTASTSTALGGESTSSSDSALMVSMTVDEFVDSRNNTEEGVARPGSVPDSELENFYRVTRSGTQMTSSPGADNVALFRIGKGTLVDMVESQGGWARVSIPGGLPVWVSAQYLEINDGRATVTGNRVRARAAPGTHKDNPILGLLHENLNLMLVQHAGEWVRVLAPDWITAWVEMADLEAVTNQAQLEQAWRQQESELLSQLRKRQ